MVARPMWAEPLTPTDAARNVKTVYGDSKQDLPRRLPPKPMSRRRSFVTRSNHWKEICEVSNREDREDEEERAEEREVRIWHGIIFREMSRMWW